MLVNLNAVELDFDFYDADQGPAYVEGSEKIVKICTEMDGKKSVEKQAAALAAMQAKYTPNRMTRRSSKS